MNNNRGFVSWGFIAAMFAISLGLWVYSDWKRSDQLKTIITIPKVESAEATAKAEQAEKLPPVKLSKGLWKNSGNDVETTLSILDNNRFTVTVKLDGGKNGEYSSLGTYSIKGGTVFFKVAEGPKGMFPSNGREVVSLEPNGNLKIGDSEFLSPSELKAKADRETKESVWYLVSNSSSGLALKVVFIAVVILTGCWLALSKRG